MGRPGNPNDRQHPENRVNQSKKQLNGNILLVALKCVLLAVSLTVPLVLAQSNAESEVTPTDAETINATVDAMPLSSSTVLDALSDSARAEVERICLPVQYESGAVAYRECIGEQLDTQPSRSTAVVPATSLSFDEEFAIQQTCRAAGAVDSAAYRSCDEAQLASLQGIPEPALDRVTDDETYAVQLGCYDSQINDGVKAYRECLNESITQLLALPQPDLSTLALVDRNALQLRCSAQNPGAVAYRNCLLDATDGNGVAEANGTVNSSIDAPVQNGSELSPEPSPEPFVEPAEQAAPQTDDAVSPEVAAFPDELQPAPEVDNETTVTSTPAVESDPTVTSQAMPLPTADSSDQRETIENTDAQSETTEDTDTEALGQTPADLLIRLQTTITGMNGTTRILLWTAIGLPVLLTLLWLLMRGRKSTSEFEELQPHNNPNSSGVDTTPYRMSPAHRMSMTRDDTAEFAQRNWTTRQPDSLSSSAEVEEKEALNFTAQMDEIFGHSEAAVATTANKDTSRNTPERLDTTSDVLPTTTPSQEFRASPEPASIQEPDWTSEPVASQKPKIEADPKSTPDFAADFDSDTDLPFVKTPVSEIPAFTDFTLAPATERDDYLAWLSVQDEFKQQTLAIEFLIYWMAYSDERYSPELKTRILQLQNPGAHELIKRWTLNQDVHAFAGNLQWLQYSLSTEQHEQIINLLMALLVSENALTPSQNTLLRFLGDVFGLGPKRLDDLFQTGFAYPIPPLPELDNLDWWKRQSPDDLKRWDARSVSRQRSEIRYRVALGLPLEGELDPESIMASFKRAANRCQRQRFNRLSSRERNLVAKQLEKYEMAAESLLEVSV